MSQNNTDWWVLLMLFPVTSLCGLASLVRSGEPLSKRAIWSVILNSGLFGMGVAACLIHQFGSESLMLIFGVSVLSGLGGNAAIEFFLETAKAIIRNKSGADK